MRMEYGEKCNSKILFDVAEGKWVLFPVCPLLKMAFEELRSVGFFQSRVSKELLPSGESGENTDVFSLCDQG